jgi:hypothetical protein
MGEASGRAFIIRPFGVKANALGEDPINFDMVDKELICEAFYQTGFSGGTSGEFIQQGDTR